MKDENRQINENIIVIDYGTYEIKAGYFGDLRFVNKNVVYKSKHRSSFVLFPGSVKINSFDNDVVYHHENFGHTLDCVFSKLRPSKLDVLYLTITPFSPTSESMIDFIFSNYKFKEIHLFYDFTCVASTEFKGQDHLIISMSNSATFMVYIIDNKIVHLQKLEIGAYDIKRYINNSLHIKYNDHKVEYDHLIKDCRVSRNYQEESLAIYNKLKAKDYSSNLYLTKLPDENISVVDEDQEKVKREKMTKQRFGDMPQIDYELIQKEDNELELKNLKEKRRQKLVFYSTLARLKSTGKNIIRNMKTLIEDCEDELEKLEDFNVYIEKRKNKFLRLKEKLKQRKRLRIESCEVGSNAFNIKNKIGILTNEEEEMKLKILEAEDMELESRLETKMLNEADAITKLDPEFLPFHETVVEILRGDKTKRECVNIELIKWPEIFFYPSIIRCPQMGIIEAIDNLAKQFSISNVFLTGGLSRLKGLQERIYSEVKSRTSAEDVNVVVVEDATRDPFFSLGNSTICYQITRDEWMNDDKRCTI